MRGGAHNLAGPWEGMPRPPFREVAAAPGRPVALAPEGETGKREVRGWRERERERGRGRERCMQTD